MAGLLRHVAVAAATAAALLFLVADASTAGASTFYASDPNLGSARVVFQVDKGFVAQVAAVVGGRTAPMNDKQEQEAEKTIVG